MDTTSSRKENQFDINIREILRPYLKRWWWFMVSVLFFLTYAFYYLAKTSPVFNVQSTVLIKDSRRAPTTEMGALSQLGGFGSSGANSIENEMEIIKSKKLFRDVVNSLDLQAGLIANNGLRKEMLYGDSAPLFIKVVNEKKMDRPLKKPFKLRISGDKLEIFSEEFPNVIVTTYNKTVSLPFANLIFVKNKNYIPSKKQKLGDLQIDYDTKEGATDNYQGLTNVNLVNKDGTVVSLSMNYANIQKAKDVINKLVELYNNDAITDKNSESKKTRDFIEERIAIIANELGEVENQKEQFKIANKITDIPTEAAYSYSGGETARARLADMETQIALSNDMINYLNKLGANQTMPSTVGLNNPLASANITTYNQLVLERNRLLENATPQNPLVVDVNKQIGVVRASVIDALRDYRTSLVTTRNQVINQENFYTGKISKIPAQEKLFRSIERQQQVKENLYLLLLQKREEAAISLAITSPKARIIDYAYNSPFPVSPKSKIVYGVALFLALLLPAGFIYLREFMNNKIRSKKDISRLSTNPILGEIPLLDRGSSEIVEINDISPVAEAFRILITNVQYMLPKKPLGKVIFVTSTTKGEGKTFISMNIALTLASSKNKVIIIGADIRNPQLQRYDFSKKRAVGLTEYLYDDTSEINDFINVSNINPHLDVIYSGSIPPNPTELLSNGRYQKMITELQKTYNYIIVDTAPLMLVTDTFLTADLADATVYVVRAGTTEEPLINFADNQMKDGKIKNAGFVLNAVEKEFFGYGNKYGYGYGNNDKTFLQKLKDKIFP